MVVAAQPRSRTSVSTASTIVSRTGISVIAPMSVAPRSAGERSLRLSYRSALDRDEVDLLAHSAVGARPVVRDVRPRGAGRESLTRVAALLVVLVAADLAAIHRHAVRWCPTGRPYLTRT